MLRRVRRPLKTWWRRGVLLLGLAAGVLGLWGFLLAGGNECAAPLHWRQAALTTLQLFVLNVPQDGICNWQGWTAAFLAPLATAGAAVAAFGARANRWRELLLLWPRPATDVFLGGGDTAAGIAMRRTGGKVIALDLHVQTPLAREMETLRAPCFQHAGNALAHEQVAPLRLHRARNVWVTAGDDRLNLEIARRVRGWLAGRPPRDGAVRLLVNVFDRHLVRAAAELFPPLENDRTRLEFFSMPRLAARTLLLRHPPRPLPGRRAPHLLIIGSGDLAEALVVHAAQHCVYDEDPRHSVRITLAGTQAGALHARLLQRHPALAAHGAPPALDALLPLARITAADCDECELGPQLWQRLQGDGDGAEPFSAVYVACEHDVRTLAAARHAAALREAAPPAEALGELPVVACLQQAPGSLCAVPAGGGPQPIAGLHRFAVYEQCIRPDEDYPGQRQDDRAMLVKLEYDRDEGRTLQGSRYEQGLQAWAEEDEPLRWSNRLAADHIEVKLDLLFAHAGLPRPPGLQPSQAAERFERMLADEAVLSMLCRLEHRRFVAERLLDGWLPLPPQRVGSGGPSGLGARQQKTGLRLNATLLPFDVLPPGERRKDEKLVRATPEILRIAEEWRRTRGSAA